MKVVSDGSSTAGETFSLVCSVETEEGVRSEDMSISWTTPDGTVIETENLTTEGNVTTGILDFFPLSTSDRGDYRCTGRIVAGGVGVNVSNDSSQEIISVTSESSPIILQWLMPSLSLSPSSRGVSDLQHWWRASLPGNRAGHHLHCLSGPSC